MANTPICKLKLAPTGVGKAELITIVETIAGMNIFIEAKPIARVIKRIDKNTIICEWI